jgi:pilus assembly protein CpaB
MRPKSLLLLALALGCGLVASIGITQVMAKRGEGSASSGLETQPILVALDKIPQWTPLSAQVLKLEDWPKDKVPPGAVTKMEDVEGRRTRTAIYPGEPILDTKIFDRGANEHGATVMIPKGLRVVSVKVDSVSGGSGLILPGDRVDVAVILRADHTRGVPDATTKTFLQDIKVFAVNDQFQVDSSTDDKSITAKTVSLLVTPEQAQMVMVASEAGKIQLVMRSPDEKDQTSVQATTLKGILEGGEKTDRNKESLVLKKEEQQQPVSTLAEKFREFLKNRGGAAKPLDADASATEPPAETWTMRFVKSDGVEDITLERHGDVWKSNAAPASDPTAAPGAAPNAPSAPDNPAAPPAAAEPKEPGPSGPATASQPEPPAPEAKD